MSDRLIALGVLVASGLIAWLTVTVALAARLLQGVVVVSVLYVTYLAWRGWRAMRRAIVSAASSEAPPGAGSSPDGDLPWISVVVPARNESAVIGQLTAALAGQRYADARGRRFDVVIVDDGSSDATAEAAQAAIPDDGGDAVRVVRRAPGDGPQTKGAALAFAHDLAGGEVIGVLDADARVPLDFLARVMRAWQRDPGAAAIQAQRRPSNASAGWLAAAQDEELVMDMASQCGREETDGTAELRGNAMFVWRMALERVGGWAPEALTEDLDLSTRLTLSGERVALAPDAEVLEQAVVEPRALWRQRMRWAEGSVRRLLDHGPRLLANGDLPIGRRLDFLVFTAEFVVPPLFVASTLATVMTAALPGPTDATVPFSLLLAYGLGTYLLALAGLAAHGERGARLLGRSLRGALFLSHWLLVIPVALIQVAVGSPTRVFAQTPHHRIDERMDR